MLEEDRSYGDRLNMEPSLSFYEENKKDIDQLQQLEILHFATGAFYFLLAIVFIRQRISNWNYFAPQFHPLDYASFGPVVDISILVVATIYLALLVIAGRCIRNRTNRQLVILCAGVNLLNPPLGMILGICTSIVMNRPSVIQVFARRQSCR